MLGAGCSSDGAVEVTRPPHSNVRRHSWEDLGEEMARAGPCGCHRRRTRHPEWLEQGNEGR